MTVTISQGLNYSLKPKNKFNLLEKDKQGTEKKKKKARAVGQYAPNRSILLNHRSSRDLRDFTLL